MTFLIEQLVLYYIQTNMTLGGTSQNKCLNLGLLSIAEVPLDPQRMLFVLNGQSPQWNLLASSLEQYLPVALISSFSK